MRTTLTLDDDVAAMLRNAQKKCKRSLKQVVNEGLRRGLPAIEGESKRPPFRTRTFDLGECKLDSIDNISEVLDLIEGPWHR